MAPQSSDVVIIGAGPAGLTAAYLLAKEDRRVTVLEADARYVGGLSRTVEYKGFHFDIGGHRFFTKSSEVDELWSELLPHDMLERRRMSRIYYRGRFYSYPLKLGEALRRLGPLEALACLISYFKTRVTPAAPALTFEDWVSAQFGRRLFNVFFKTYTEKVWGMPCSEISADWAAQRIKGLSLGSAIRHALTLPWQARTNGQIKTLTGTFRYPRKGPGMMWEACVEQIVARGGRVLMGRRVDECRHERGQWNIVHTGPDGREAVETASHLISSAALSDLIPRLRPRPSVAAQSSAGALRYRDFLTVVLVLRTKHAFDDQWIYIHDPGVRVARIQNFKAWSPEMVPDPTLECYGLEYFCSRGDDLWNMNDTGLMALAQQELLSIGLAAPGDVIDGSVVRQTKAYPVYDAEYARHVGHLRTELESAFPTLHLVGRNGLHRYNNQDHAMMTAMLTVRNILAGGRIYDVWRVNEDAEYLEPDATSTSGASGLRRVPQRLAVEPGTGEAR